MTDAPFVPKTANDLWSFRVAQNPDKVAFKYKKGGVWLDVTWRQVDETCRAMAGGLIGMGLAPGDRVCLVSQTRFEWMLADVAILLCGGVTVPIYPSSTADQCAFIVKDSGARIVIVEDAAQIEKVAPLVQADPSLKVVYFTGDAPLDRPDARGRSQVALVDVLGTASPAARACIGPWVDLEAAGKKWLGLPANAEQLDQCARAAGPDDLFTIIYTSGTTGNPKGVVLSHHNLVSSLASACRALTLRDDDLQYLWLTLSHVLGREMLWAPILAGSVTAFTEGLPKIKENLTEIRPTFMAGVPRVFEKFYTGVQTGLRQGSGIKKALVNWSLEVGGRRSALIRKGEIPGAFLSWQHGLADKLVFSKLRAKLGLDRCRFLISGGAPLAAEIAEFFHTAGLLILEGYGLTETVGAACVNAMDRYRFGTVGPAIDVMEIQIASDGEILMRGPSVFRGYYNNPAATAEALDADGWFHTGDIGHLEDGFLRITDRKKDIIVLAVGKKVAPQIVENALKMFCPLISQVLVYGDNRSFCVALVTLTEDAAKLADARPRVAAAIEALNGTLAGYEQIKKFEILTEDFSEQNGQLTPSFKVKRKVVSERHRTVIDSMYR